MPLVVVVWVQVASLPTHNVPESLERITPRPPTLITVHVILVFCWFRMRSSQYTMSIMLVLSCIIALVAGSYPRDLLLGRRHRGLSAEGGDVEDGDKRVYPRQSTGARFTFYDTGLGACGVYNKSTDFVSLLFLFVV